MVGSSLRLGTASQRIELLRASCAPLISPGAQRLRRAAKRKGSRWQWAKPVRAVPWACVCRCLGKSWCCCAGEHRRMSSALRVEQCHTPPLCPSTAARRALSFLPFRPPLPHRLLTSCNNNGHSVFATRDSRRPCACGQPAPSGAWCVCTAKTLPLPALQTTTPLRAHSSEGLCDSTSVQRDTVIFAFLRINLFFTMAKAI